MAITQNLYSANKLVLEAFDSGWRTYEIVGDRFFNKQVPERYTEKFVITAADGAINSVAPSAAYPAVDVSEIGNVSVTQAAYKKEIPVDFLMKEFDNYGVVLREAQKHGYRAKITMDQVMANVLLNCEGTSTVWDGYALAYATHRIGNTASTQTNIATGALSESVLNAADVILGTLKDHGNQVMPTTGRYHVHPKALSMTSHKLLQSTEGPETANREKGYLNTLGITSVTWPLLDASNAVDSHLISDKMFNRLEYLVKVEPRVNVVRDPDTGNTLYQIEFACAATAADYLGYVFLNAA
jgi:hypothetical protein